MSRPEISVEHPEIFQEYYVDYERTPRIGHTLTTAMTVLHPRIIYAEGSREEIIDHHRQGGLIGINASHQNITDQSHIAILPRRDPEVFGHLEGVARIATKVPLFKNSALQGIIEELGAFPLVRYKDERKRLGRNLNEQELAKLRSFQDAAIQAEIEMINKRQDIAKFPQGTREADATRVREGIGRIATGINADIDFALLPIGFYFPEFKLLGKKNVFRPTMYIGRLIVGPFSDIHEVTDNLFEGITDCVKQAEAHTPKRILYRAA